MSDPNLTDPDVSTDAAMEPTLDWALAADERDPLRGFRDEFLFPSSPARPDGRMVYLAGNSLGLQPRGVEQAVREEVQDWAHLAVDAHLEGRHPWYSYHEQFRDVLGRIVGADPGEIVVMNSLTINLHLLFASFYRPTNSRFRIAIEPTAFPSDAYAVTSQIAWHGLDPSTSLVRLRPRDGEMTLRTQDIERFLEREGESVAILWLGAVNYLTGQWFDMDRITAAARAWGCLVGWDLAHAAGNVPTRLHDCGADFAVWCSYKYLNAGPGAVAGAFVHERHASDPSVPRLAGWWGNDPATRFQMRPEFVPRPGADGWQVSNPLILAMAPLRISLEQFERAGIEAVRAKSVRLTGYLEFLLARSLPEAVSIITPGESAHRGAQLSLSISGDAPRVQQALRERGIVCDVREPNIIRVAPAPLYNTFADVWAFVDALAAALRE